MCMCSADAYHCPVTFKVFNENSNIVAIRSTGNVFSYEVCMYNMHTVFSVDCTSLYCVYFQAVERLNLKPRHFHDLLTDEPFTRADIITLQDPMAPEKFDVTNFYHVKNKLAVKEGSPMASCIAVTGH